MARAIDQRCVGISIAVEIGPDKLPNAGDGREGVRGQECAVAVVSQDKGKAGGCACHNVEVAICLDVNGPGPGIGRSEQSRGQLCLAGDIGECLGRIWRRNRRPPAPARTRSVLKS